MPTRVAARRPSSTLAANPVREVAYRVTVDPRVRVPVTVAVRPYRTSVLSFT